MNRPHTSRPFHCSRFPSLSPLFTFLFSLFTLHSPLRPQPQRGVQNTDGGEAQRNPRTAFPQLSSPEGAAALPHHLRSFHSPLFTFHYSLFTFIFSLFPLLLPACRPRPPAEATGQWLPPSTGPVVFSGVPFRLLALHDGPPDAPLCFHAAVDAPAPPEDAPPPSRSPTLLRFRALPPDNALSLRRSLEPLLPALGVRDPEWLFPDELLAPLRRWQRLLSVFASAAAALSLLLGAASLSALMLANAEKRIPEMGLRRALGARPADIFLLFLKDALLLVLLSFALAALTAPLAFAALPADFPLALRFTPRILLSPAILAALLAALASLPPALHTLRLSPALALRSD